MTSVESGRRPLVSLALAVLAAWLGGCVASSTEPEPGDETPRFDPFAQPLFERLDPTETGVDLQEPDSVSVGVGVADVDGDGLPDLFVTDWYRSKLFRNLGDFQFEEQDDSAWRQDAPPAGPGGGPPPARDAIEATAVWGVTFADYDNDGDPDLFLLTAGRNRLLRNDGDFVFTDVTDVAGMPGAEMTYALALQDYDRDGLLDLYVVNHLDIRIELSDPGEPPVVEVLPASDYLLRAVGDGSFEDVTHLLPAGTLDGTGWMATWADFDDDGDRDLYVASELRVGAPSQPNHLFRNDGPDGVGGWRFGLADEGCGCDLTMAPMGLAAGDYDRDGRTDLYMTNTYIPGAGQTSGIGEVLLRNLGGLSFADVGLATGANLGAQEGGRRTISWGTDFFDADNDGWLDLAVGYGPFEEDLESAQPNGLLISEAGSFRVHEESGTSVDDETRGLLAVDLNGDGCLDLVEAHRFTQPGVFANRCDSPHRWLQIELEGTTSPRDAFGARVRVTAGGVTWTEELVGGTVHSSPWTTLHFGLGQAEAIEAVEIRWPSGLVERRTDLPVDARLHAVEGAWGE